MKRKIVQASIDQQGTVCAVSDDGTAWTSILPWREWKQLPPLPDADTTDKGGE